MALLRMRLFLSAYYPGGRPVQPGDFLAGLGVNIAPYTSYGEAGQWCAVGLDIAALQLSEFEQFKDERHEEYEKAVQRIFVAFAAWLATVPAENMKELRAGGLEVYVLMNLDMDQDQMDLNLPPELCPQLGRLGLRLHMLSNE